MNRYILLLLSITLTSCATNVSNQALNTNTGHELTWPTSPETPRIQFVKSFKTPEDLNIKKGFLQRFFDFFVGSEQNRLSRPYAISVFKESVAVADPDSSSVHIYDTLRGSYQQIKNAGQYNLESPIGIAHYEDRLFISDSKLNKVFILNSNFELLKVLDNFDRPTGITLDKENHRLFVADTLAHNISIFNTDGIFLQVIGERGEAELQFNFPSHLAFANNSLVINDTMNFRIQSTDDKGNYTYTFGKQGDASGYLTQPKGIAVDSDGNIYIADAIANRVQIFNQKGEFLLEFGKRGKSLGDFNMPAGLAISDDQIYVADSYNQRIQVFQYLKVEK